MKILGRFLATSLGLVALYLVLTNAFGAEKVLGATSRAYVDILRTLQGR